MPGPCRGYTTPHRCLTINYSKRNQPSDRDHQAQHRLQEKVTDFYVQFHGSIYLSIGPEEKRDIYNNFDPDKCISVHLDPPSTEIPPLIGIKQKCSIYTTDFLLYEQTLDIPTPPLAPNNTTPAGEPAAATDPSLFDADPLQPGEVCLHFWSLYTSQAPILDLTDEDIKSMLKFKHAFHALNLCPNEDTEETLHGREETRSTNESK